METCFLQPEYCLSEDTGFDDGIDNMIIELDKRVSATSPRVEWSEIHWNYALATVFSSSRVSGDVRLRNMIFKSGSASGSHLVGSRVTFRIFRHYFNTGFMQAKQKNSQSCVSSNVSRPYLVPRKMPTLNSVKALRLVYTGCRHLPVATAQIGHGGPQMIILFHHGIPRARKS